MICVAVATHILFFIKQNVYMSVIKKLNKSIIAILLICIIALLLPPTSSFAEVGEELYLGGFPAGFVLNTQSVEVIGLVEVSTNKGSVCPARDGGILTGDIIKGVNGIEITSSEMLTQTLNENFAIYNFEIERDDRQFTTTLKPAYDKKTNKKTFGMLVRDALNGIGTVTYVNKTDLSFGSLGHPISNSKGELIKINGGTVLGCSIYDVKRGMRGNPGELKGLFDNTKLIGKVEKNTQCGIYGKVNENYNFDNLTKITRTSVKNVKIGNAEIYSTLDGGGCRKYDISIVKVDCNNSENKNFVIKIDDNLLIEKSGGIVQGMSGSPIVQNGKLIGAVTHVFVNDPTRGYGISIENMINS